MKVSRRLIGLLAALVLAGAGTYALYSYVTKVEDRALEDVEVAQVYVANGTITAGTPAQQAIGQGQITRVEVPRRAVADNAIGSLEQIQGMVATTTITNGEQILTTRFGSTAGTSTGLLQVPADRQGVSVEVGVLPGLAGFAKPGDRVSIVARVEEPDPADPSGATLRPRIQFVVQDALVLAIGHRIVLKDQQGKTQGYQLNESNDRYLYTVAVRPPDVERLLWATQEASIWFTMLPVDEQPPVNSGGRVRDNLFAAS